MHCKPLGVFFLQLSELQSLKCLIPWQFLYQLYPVHHVSELEDFLLVQHQLSYSVTAAIIYSAKDKNNTIHKNLYKEAESAHLDFGCLYVFFL